MKKNIVYLMALLALTFSACSKSEDGIDGSRLTRTVTEEQPVEEDGVVWDGTVEHYTAKEFERIFTSAPAWQGLTTYWYMPDGTIKFVDVLGLGGMVYALGSEPGAMDFYFEGDALDQYLFPGSYSYDEQEGKLLFENVDDFEYYSNSFEILQIKDNKLICRIPNIFTKWNSDALFIVAVFTAMTRQEFSEFKDNFWVMYNSYHHIQ